MVKRRSSLDGTFAALADSTRRDILVRLTEGERTVGELAAPFRMSLPAVSKHLRVLEDAGLIVRERDGRVRRCRLEPKPLASALEWMASYGAFWEDQFDSLERFLAEQRKEDR